MLARRLQSLDAVLLSLCVVSLTFYCYWNWKYGLLILASTVFNHTFVRWLPIARAPRATLTFAIFVNLAVLAYYKYVDFAITQLGLLFGVQIAPFGIELPIAISFFTFQQIAFLVDTYRGEVSPISYLRYLFIVVFFPHLLAGPIVRFSELAPQIDEYMRRNRVWTDVAVGLTLFSIGLFKKVCLADSFAEIANAGFQVAVKGAPLGMVDAWATALAYTFQIYFDFSGYSDMALGLARLFGFKFTINFFSPYKAVGFSDFWGRWHISLSRFLRDYLYISLGGNRNGLATRYRNLIVTMVLGGLWHGANWTFAVWGLGHGLLLVVEDGLKRLTAIFGLSRLMSTYPAQVAAMLLTFVCIVLLWVPFRAPDFQTTLHVYRAMFSPSVLFATPIAYGWTYQSIMAFLGLGFVICWGLPNAYEIMDRARPGLIHHIENLERTFYWRSVQWRPIWPISLVSAGLVLASFYRMGTSISEFLYFRF